MDPDQLEHIWRPYRQELRRDYVSLSELVRRTRRVHPNLSDDELRHALLQLLGYVLRRREAQAGQFAQGREFVGWEQTPEEILERIEREWQALGPSDPAVGAIMWLREPR